MKPTQHVDTTRRVEGAAGAGRIEILGVGHEYRRPGTDEAQIVLDSVNLEIAAREFVCLLGPSGCGKSTLLMIVAGLLQPKRGSVAVDGVQVSGPSRERGVVFQDYALLPWKSVSSNVALGPRLAGASRREARQTADEFLALVGLEGVGDKYPHELSGGMRQRAAVARTLAARPKVLLMDEPFAAVDAQTRTLLQEELVGIWRELGQTVIFVTHSVEESVLLADRVVLMGTSPGRIKDVVPITLPHEGRFEIDAAMQVAKAGSVLLESLRDNERGGTRADRAKRSAAWGG